MGNTSPKKELTDYMEEEPRNVGGPGDPKSAGLESEKDVLCEFVYTFPANSVQITGNFLENWKRFEPMVRRDGVFYF